MPDLATMPNPDVTNQAPLAAVPQAGQAEPVSPQAEPQLQQPQPELQQPQPPSEEEWIRPLKPGETPQPGDVVTFAYSKHYANPLGTGEERKGKHDPQPLVLVIDWKTKYPDRLRGVNLHYLDYNKITQLIQMARQGTIQNYTSVKNVILVPQSGGRKPRAIGFRDYLMIWLVENSIQKINIENIQTQVNTIKTYGLRNIETLRKVIAKQNAMRPKQPTAMQMATPITPVAPVKAVVPAPAIPTGNMLNTQESAVPPMSNK